MNNLKQASCRRIRNNQMLNPLQITLILISTLMIGAADAIIKKVGAANSFGVALKDPWLILASLLYLLQIGIIVYIFVHKGDLVVYGNIFIIFYSITTVLLGLLVFKEHISLTQIIGIVFALIGAVLINRQQ
jgi:drug/metabolite transporter (DMT)-like permease